MLILIFCFFLKKNGSENKNNQVVEKNVLKKQCYRNICGFYLFGQGPLDRNGSRIGWHFQTYQIIFFQKCKI
jgi:hypothetical protein